MARRGRRMFFAVMFVTTVLSNVARAAPVEAASTGTCGVERWSVKTGTDPDAGTVDQAHPSPTTVGYLDGLPAPASRPANARVRPVETTVYSVTATLTDYVMEDDSDYHLVLRDPQGRSMIVEIPDPGCVGQSSPFRPAISQARADFDGKLSATTGFKTANVAVRVTGVGFWDDNHGQRGVAPNAIELHPVTAITFDPAAGTGTCQPTLPAGTVKAAAASPGGAGYLMAAEAGGVAVFGDQPCEGSLAGTTLSAPVVAAAASPSGAGYWLVGADGGVFSFGDARFFGSTGNLHLNKPVVGMSATADGGGYRFVATDGGIFSYGSAAFHGSMGGSHLNQPIVGMGSAPAGDGYWLVARDGGIFSFGTGAGFHGSTGGMKLNQPIVGMTPTTTGAGYWLVASDGGIFSFGDAHFFGSAGDIKLSRPITAMAATPTGAGYWLFASDGGVFTYGDARYAGSAVATTPAPASSTPTPGGPSPPASSGSCSASMDNANPAKYSTVHVLVASHLANASVTTVAHYKTTDTTKTGTTDGAGKADIAYSISGATSGYSVKVDVNVAGKETCTTQFTPQ
jgi:hypothetical protein